MLAQLRLSVHYRLNWFYHFRQLNAQHLRQLKPLYNQSGSKAEELNKAVEFNSKGTTSAATTKGERDASQKVVCIFNGNFENGGLADRLRTIVCTYQLCQELGLDFRIHFTHPFRLQEYLVPNAVDWQIEDNDVSFSPQTDIVCCEMTDDTEYQDRKLYAWLKNRLQQSKAPQIHVYGNPAFCYRRGTYATLFHQLFCISPSLQNAINEQLQRIGSHFIAIQLRFVCLLGDFTDVGCETLPPDLQQQLIEGCLQQLRNIGGTLSEGEKMLVNSDSNRFLQAVQRKIPEAYIVAGSLAHPDYTPQGGGEAWQKLFLDFFLMSHARTIYRILGPGMRPSGLPRSAALLGDIECKDIHFTV